MSTIVVCSNISLVSVAVAVVVVVIIVSAAAVGIAGLLVAVRVAV